MGVTMSYGSIGDYRGFVLDLVRECYEWRQIKHQLRKRGYTVVLGDCKEVRGWCREEGIKLSMGRDVGNPTTDFYDVNGI